MAARPAPSSNEIIELLVRLKAQTPDYPVHLLEARKAVFLNHVTTLKIQGKGPGGEAGGQGGSTGTGGSGTALGGSTTAQGIILQATIGFGLVASMLVGAYFLRDQVSGHLEEEVAAVVQSSDGTILPVTGASEEPAEFELIVATPEISPTPTATVVTESVIENKTIYDDEFDDPSNIDDIIDGIKDNPGLHLGQATGTPAAPGQGNPGNENQPDQPDKPDKPEKPDNPGRGR